MPTLNQKVMENIVKVFSQHYSQFTKKVIQFTNEITLVSRLVISDKKHKLFKKHTIFYSNRVKKALLPYLLLISRKLGRIYVLFPSVDWGIFCMMLVQSVVFFLLSLKQILTYSTITVTNLWFWKPYFHMSLSDSQ